MRFLVITNPVAGNEAPEILRAALRRHLEAAGHVCELHATRSDERPTALVQARLRDGVERVVAAGGDGTVAAVIEGLVGSNVPLGIVPTGTGNLVARELGIPLDPDAAVALLAGPSRQRRIDAMRIGGRIYVLNVSVGLSASVVAGVTRGEKSRFGRVAYAVRAIGRLFTLQPRRLRVEVDGMPRRYRAVEVTVMNCGSLARMVRVQGPEIRPDDGRINVWIPRAKSPFDYFRHLFDVLRGHPARPFVKYRTATHSVDIRCRRPLPAQADGDSIGTTPVHVDVLPSAVAVLVPAAR